MTIITKSSEKKGDSLQDPLVENIVIEQDEPRKSDVEAGGYPIPPSETARYIISARVRPYYSLMFILMLVILVATSILGIFGTQYLYEEYKYLMGAEQQPGVYRTWGTFNYGDEPYSAAYESRVPLRFERTDESTDNDILSVICERGTVCRPNSN